MGRHNLEFSETYEDSGGSGDEEDDLDHQDFGDFEEGDDPDDWDDELNAPYIETESQMFGPYGGMDFFAGLVMEEAMMCAHADS